MIGGLRPRRVLTAGALALSAALMWSAGTGTASAATSADNFTINVGSAKAPDLITCKLRVHRPHYSHHAHAADKHRVNVTADVKCSKKVATLRIKVRLKKNGQNYKTSGWRTNHGKNQISQNAARRCIKKQNYQGEAWAVVTFPPGYKPPTAAAHVKSAVVKINACKKS